MATYLITGTSRGLGLELISQLLRRGNIKKIFATARNPTPSKELQSVLDTNPSLVKFVQLDVDNPSSIHQAVATVKADLDGEGLDVLINNAGVLYVEPEGAPKMHALQRTLETNVVGVHNVSSAFLPLLRLGKAKKLVNITSTMGSISLKDFMVHAPTASYKISKAALNMMTAQYSLDLKDEGFIVAGISPGWLKTDLGGPGADLDVGQGAAATLDIIEKLGPEDNGAFKNIYIEGSAHYDGQNAPW